MLILVEIDLAGADLALFEDYEARVLARLGEYGATIEARLLSADRRRELHLLHFPDRQAREDFRNDPVRLAAQDLWTRCGASAVSSEVTRIA